VEVDVGDANKLAYDAKAWAFRYGAGGQVTASFLCATPEKAKALREFLESLARDDPPGWDAPPHEQARRAFLEKMMGGDFSESPGG
jgi:hypothetical protein